MEYTPELTKSLNDLQRIVGLSLDIHAGTAEEMNEAASQIRLLCSAYKNKYDRNYFLQELIYGRIPVHDVHDMAARFHINPDERRILYLLEAGSPIEGVAMEILKNLFPSTTKTYLIPTDRHHVAILQTLKKRTTPDMVHRTACMISDTLNTEALISVNISYSRFIETLEDVPSAFQDSNLALKIGNLFNSGQTIYPCSRLGIGQLIYQLPVPLCENFLAEIFGDNIPYTLDDDLIHAVNVFFRNNLNIAETARQLHMHRNTFIYRLEQIEKNTGLDLRLFEDAMNFKIASMIISYLESERSN